MSSLINTFLATGRQIRTLEQRLCAMALHHPDRKRVGAEHSRLVRRQQGEIVAAVDAGVDWSTVRFALALHGQAADREVGSAEPTPAELMLNLMREYGPFSVLEGLEMVRRFVDEAAVAEGSERA